MAAVTESQQLGEAIIAFSLDGRFPDDATSLPAVSETDLQPALESLANTKVKLEVRPVSICVGMNFSRTDNSTGRDTSNKCRDQRGSQFMGPERQNAAGGHHPLQDNRQRYRTAIGSSRRFWRSDRRCRREGRIFEPRGAIQSATTRCSDQNTRREPVAGRS